MEFFRGTWDKIKTIQEIRKAEKLIWNSPRTDIRGFSDGKGSVWNGTTVLDICGYDGIVEDMKCVMICRQIPNFKSISVIGVDYNSRVLGMITINNRGEVRG